MTYAKDAVAKLKKDVFKFEEVKGSFDIPAETRAKLPDSLIIMDFNNMTSIRQDNNKVETLLDEACVKLVSCRRHCIILYHFFLTQKLYGLVL